MNTLLGLVVGIIGLLPIEYGLFKVIYFSVSLIISGHGIWFYWQFSQQAKYTKTGRAWRVTAAYLIVIMALALGQQFFMGVAAVKRATNGKPATEVLE